MEVMVRLLGEIIYQRANIKKREKDVTREDLYTTI